MRTDEDGRPLVHRVRTDKDVMREAQMGLDQLLKQAEVLSSREARAKAARQTEEELEIIRQRRMRQAQILAERFEWKPIAAVVMLEHQECLNCGNESTIFRGFGTLYQRKADFTERVAAADCLDRGLPFQQRRIDSKAPCCAACLPKYGAEMEPPAYEFHPQGRPDDQG